MPNIQSAKKRVKVSKTKNLRNRMVKSGVKTSIKKFNAALAEGAQPAAAQLSATTSAIDKAVAKGVITKNVANRRKSRAQLCGVLRMRFIPKPERGETTQNGGKYGDHTIQES